MESHHAMISYSCQGCLINRLHESAGSSDGSHCHEPSMEAETEPKRMETKSCRASRRKPIPAKGTGQGERGEGQIEKRAQRSRREFALTGRPHHPTQRGSGFPVITALLDGSHQLSSCFPCAGSSGRTSWHKESSMSSDHHQLGDKTLSCTHSIGLHTRGTSPASVLQRVGLYD